MPRLLRAKTYQARRLRRNSTPAEQALWQMLRGRRLAGAKFRRQHPLGPFIVDFFCESAGLVIEADGAPHFPPPRRDQIRDSWLKAAGLTVLRLPNHEIIDQPEGVAERIRHLLAALVRSPLSLRERGRG